MVRRLVIVGLTVALVAGACGDDDDDGGNGGSTETPASGSGFETLLAQIPDTDETRSSVLLNDYAAAREAADLEQPDADADEDELLEYALEITGARIDEVPVTTLPAMLSGSRSGAREEDWRAEYGFAFSDLQADAYAGRPPDQIELFEGRIDAEAVADAVSDDETWSDALEEESHAGVDFYSWGGERDPERVTPVRPIGVGGALLVDEPRAVLTQNPETMEEAIDVQTGDEPSLADREEFAAMAAAVEDLGAYSAFFSDEAIGLDVVPGDGPADLEEVDDLALEPYSAYAIGGALDGDDPYVVIALAHDDAEVAEENADRLEQMVEEGVSLRTAREWSETFEVEEIATEGTLVTARLRIVDGPPGIWFNIVTQRDTLIATAA